ncbi:MAG: hypothetical protein JWO94_1274 [Verrucomicrobiaceae bacterium]|nr:hypothetical protein [Verrucomicrobiaceae bacterium]
MTRFHLPYLLALALLCLAACNIRPLEFTQANGQPADWLGGSLLTSSASETATITKKDGTVLSYTRKQGDETLVASKYIGAGVLKAGIAGGTSVLNHAASAAKGATGSASGLSPALIGATVGAGGMGLINATAPTKPAPPSSP